MNKSIKREEPFLSGNLILIGLLAGSLDILAAFADAWLSNGTSPIRILKIIASGAFGPSAREGGGAMIAFGLIIHFTIALSFSLFFYLIYPFLVKYISNKVLQALLYGLFIWSVMNRIVLGFTWMGVPPFDFYRMAKAALILTAAVGLPLAFLVPRFTTAGKRPGQHDVSVIENNP